MTTAHLALAQQVVSLLQAGTPVAPLIKLGALQPAKLGTSTAVFVRLLRSPGRDITATGAGAVQWTTLVGVECVARASAGQDPLTAIDPLIEAVYARLAAAPQLAGSLSELLGEPEIQWEIAEAETPIATALIAVRVQHITGPASLAAFA